MGRGKVAAQCAHAALGAYRKAKKASEAVIAAEMQGGPPAAAAAAAATWKAIERLALWLDLWEQRGETKVVLRFPVRTPLNPKP